MSAIKMLAQDSSTGYALSKEQGMASITIRNLSPDIVENLKTLAADNGRSMEQEVREILACRFRPRGRLLDEIKAVRPDVQPPSAHEVQEWIASGRRSRE
jgi:plasmid stability protein